MDDDDIDAYNSGFLAGYHQAGQKLAILEKLHRRLIRQLPDDEHEGRFSEMETTLESVINQTH